MNYVSHEGQVEMDLINRVLGLFTCKGSSHIHKRSSATKALCNKLRSMLHIKIILTGGQPIDI